MDASPRPPALPPDPIARSLRALHREAAWSAIMSGCTEPFMIPYALALGATPFQAGLLSSVRNFLLSVVQLRAGEAMQWFGGRRALVVWTTVLQAALWVPLALAAPLFGRFAVAALVVCYTAGTAAVAMSNPAWGSLVSEYLPPDQRGRFFGRRAQLVGLWTTVASFGAGGVLQLTSDRPVVGFAMLCAAAAVSRVLALRQTMRLHDVPWHAQPHLRFTFRQFLAAAPRSNFARFTLCMAAYSMATHVAAPYFAVYLLEELRYGYLTYTAVVLAGSMTGMLTSFWWGRLGDQAGNWRVMRWTLAGASVLPILWTYFDHPLWLGAINVVGAFMWGGLNLSATNFVYDAVSAPKRHTCLAYFNVLNGFGVSLGAFLGGAMVRHLGESRSESFIDVFFLSAILRLAVAAVFRLAVREVRPVRQIGLRQVVLDLVGQRLVGVLGFFQKPEEERRALRAARRAREREEAADAAPEA